jgi:hypothetical protein
LPIFLPIFVYATFSSITRKRARSRIVSASLVQQADAGSVHRRPHLVLALVLRRRAHPAPIYPGREIAQLEWSAALARHENTLVALRDLREHLRLRDRLVGDLERTVRDAAEAAAATEPRLADLLAEDTRRREAAA